MNNKVFIIAEIGINFNGSLENCLKMIDAAVAAKCDCAKFQFFFADTLYPRTAGVLEWKDLEKDYSYDIHDAVKKFELPSEWLDKIIAYCEYKKIDFSSSVFDMASAELLYKKGIKNFKISSNSITNIPFIKYCASKNIPLLISTGGSTIGEVDEAVSSILKYHNKISLLHCSLKYPTLLSECNLGVIETLKLAFPDLTPGYSDHTIEIHEAPVQAVYLGAQVIEKHITLDKKMPGPDHFFALEPEELKQMVIKIREAEINLTQNKIEIDKLLYGCSARKTYPHEKYIRDFSYMCCFAARKIRKGDIIAAGDIQILRPGKKKRGIEPKYLQLFINNAITAKCDIELEEAIKWEFIL